MERSKQVMIPLVAGLALGCAGCDRTSRADAGELIAAYTRATCVPPHALDRSVSNPTREWDDTFDLGSDVAVKIGASCAAGGSLKGKYSDEPEPRTIAGADDSLYPCDLRIDWMQMRLYVRAQNPDGASQRVALYEYDLQARRSPRESEVDPAVLPPRCEIAQEK